MKSRVKQAVILAGGLGTRISEESYLRPKPMVEIGGRPILWHIMKYYSQFGVNQFVICAGYKSNVIKDYFINYHLHNSSIEFKTRTGECILLNTSSEDWNVKVIETGLDTQTGGRLLAAAEYLDHSFFLTYGDGLSNVDISVLENFHFESQKEISVTAVSPPGRFGALEIQDGAVEGFVEKPVAGNAWINGGFFVVQKKFLERIDGKDTLLEQAPLVNAARDGALAAYKHDGFWQPMDTLREKNLLDEMYKNGGAPWKIWKD